MHVLLSVWMMVAGAEPEPETKPVETTEAVDVVTPPRLLETVAADRPDGADDQAVEVLLSLEIDTEGRVTRAEVVESGGDAFDVAAREAARRFRFEPATAGGEPIAVEIGYRYVFEPPPPPDPQPPPPPPLEPPPLETTIDDTEVVLAAAIDEEAAEIRLGAERGQRTPGAQGDALKAAETLAGVARPPAGQGELIIWGASASDSRRTIDGIVVPRLFHLGGTRSVLPSAMLDSVSVVPGGFSVARGRAVGGYVSAATRPARSAVDPHRVGGYVRLDPIDVGASVDARVTDRGWVALAVRRSLIAQTYGALAPASSQGLVPLPDYWDYQGKSIVEVSGRDTLTVMGFGAHDRIERGIPSVTADAEFSERRTAGFHRGGLRWQRLHGSGRTVTMLAWTGRDDEQWTQRFVPQVASSEHISWQGGLRLEERRRLGPRLRLRWGLDAEVGHHRLARQGAVTLPAREGDVVVFGQPPGDRVATDRWTVTQAGVAVYSSLKLSLAQERWSIEPGLRLEPMVTAGDRIAPVRPIEPEVGLTELAVAVDPRLQVQWSPRPALTLFTAGGRYHQAADPRDLSPVFGNPRLRPSQAYHALAGGRGSPWAWLSLELTGFYIRSLDRAARNDDPTPAVATLLLDDGQGRSFGGQVTTRIDPIPSLQLGLVYTWMRSERLDPAATRWRRFDFDQPHGLQALGSWSHRSGVELGGRLSLGSGYPRTAVVGAVANGRTGGYDPIFGAHNEDRLPLSLTVSLRVGWSRTFRWGELRTWLDVLNATNRRNVEERFYSSDYGEQGAVTGLPVVPAFGLEIRR